MNDQLLTRAEAQKILRVSKSTMFRLIRKEEIRAVRVGNTYRIPRAELERYLSNEKTTNRQQEVFV